MQSYTIDQYRLARCIQIVGDPHSGTKGDLQMFGFLHRETDGRVCDTGCAWYEGGKCSAYQMLTSTKPFSAVQPVYTETVREEAARLNLPIKEIRRRRNGTT